MASGFGESSSGRDPQNSSFGESSSNNDAASFECNICFELAQDPVVTLCGHLFCWPCLYKWLHGHAQSSECPVCKAIVEEEKLVPLYGRGKNSTDPRSKSMPGMNIPHRPAGQRPATAPPPDPNNFHHANPWFMGGAPVASTRFGNFTFSAAIGGLFPLLSFQVHGIPDATAYGPSAGFPYGYGNAFHGGHVHGFPRHVQHGQQADVYLKALLLLVGALTARYRAVASIGAVSAPLPPEIGRRRGRTWRSDTALLIPIRRSRASRCFARRIFGDRGEKKTTHELLVEASRGDFFFPYGEKE
ncbi:hypothetical protein BHE74_00051989 [Ensete ventricosum]|nr:hypothetical protein BHE74_00051989 [Ensete ventricosum]